MTNLALMRQDFLAGLLFSVAGGAFALGARHYPTTGDGTLGPGFLPQVLGLILVLLGVLICFKSLRVVGPAVRVNRHDVRVLFCILGANAAFGLMLGGLPRIGLPPLGLAPAVCALVLLAAAAKQGFRWRETLLLAVLLTLASRFLFIGLLGLPLRMWPAFWG